MDNKTNAATAAELAHELLEACERRNVRNASPESAAILAALIISGALRDVAAAIREHALQDKRSRRMKGAVMANPSFLQIDTQQPPLNADLPKLLRIIASGTDARETNHDVIFNAAADELDYWRARTGQTYRP